FDPEPDRDHVATDLPAAAVARRESLDLVADHIAVNTAVTDDLTARDLHPVATDGGERDQVDAPSDDHGHLGAYRGAVRPRGDAVWQQDQAHSLAVLEGNLQRGEQPVDIRVTVTDGGGSDLCDEGKVDDAAALPCPGAGQDHPERQVRRNHGCEVA